MKIYCIPFLAIILILNGCSDTKKSASNTNNETVKVEKINQKNQIQNIKDVFTDPHFKISNFEVKKNNRTKVFYSIDFKLDSESSKYINANKNEMIYLNIIYPEILQKKFNKYSTPNLKVRLGDITQNRFIISDNLNNADLKVLNDLNTNLQLRILNKDKQMFFLFDGLNNYKY